MDTAEDAAAIADILHFWFEEIGPDRWWTRSDDVDAAIGDRFCALWEAWRSQPAEHFLGSADDALAGVILFDQFPRNMFRGHADAFSTDSLALAIAKGAVGRGLDDAMDADARSFLYMPYQHSEDIADQERSVALFTALGLPDPIRFANLHHDMIVRFGRFPGRNAALGRHDRPGEAEGIAISKDW
jgi:uncharacterized protein (DUF924 family)